MARKKYDHFVRDEYTLTDDQEVELGPTYDDVPKRYVAVVGISLDKFKARFKPGDDVPLEYLQDPDVAFDWLLKRKAIKEIGG